MATNHFIILTILVKFSISSKLNILQKPNISTFSINDWFDANSDEQIVYATSSVDFGYYPELFTNQQPCIVYDFHVSDQRPPQSNQFKNNYYIIIEKNLQIFTQTIDKLYRIDRLNVHGKYLLIIEELITSNLFIGMIFKFFFKQTDIYNVILMNQNKFFTWYPYKDNCNDEIIIHEIVDGNVNNNFNNKLPRNLQQCPLRVAKRSLNKADILYDFVLNVVCECMNATITFVIDRSLDRKFVPIPMVQNAMRRMDVSVNLHGLNVAYYEYNHFSTFIENNYYLAVFLPRRRYIPKYLEFKVFSNQLILTTVLTIILAGCVYSLLTKQSLIDALFRIYQLSLQLSLNQLPKQWRLRIYIMFLLLFVMVISSAYLSLLSGVFTRASLETKITNVQQFLESDIPFMGSKAEITVLKQLYVGKMKRPWPEGRFLTGYSGDLIASLANKKYATMGIYTTYGVDAFKYFEIIPIPPRHITCFMYRTRLHLNELIDHHVRKIDESGFIERYVSDFLQRVAVRAKVEDYEQVVVLKLTDLSGVFIVWLYGLSIAAIVFTYEIIHYKRQQKLQRIRAALQQQKQKLQQQNQHSQK